ncbi:hypothetical protein GCM10023259_004470 [Thermocatellispora tengchongensis]
MCRNSIAAYCAYMGDIRSGWCGARLPEPVTAGRRRRAGAAWAPIGAGPGITAEAARSRFRVTAREG